MENTSSRVLGRIQLVQVNGKFVPAPPPSRRCRNNIMKDGNRACGAYFKKDGACPNARHHAAS